MNDRPELNRILIIDDDARTLKMLKRRLENEGYEVRTARRGTEGLEIFADWHPSLVLVDVNMPGMSGLDVLAEIKGRHMEIPVILITAYGSEQVAVDAVKRGANDYVNKPFNSKEICQVIQENLARSRVLITRMRLLEELKDFSYNLRTKVDQLEKDKSELEQHKNELVKAINAKSKLFSDLEDANIFLRELSIRDSLTELYNHLYFQERLSEEFHRSYRYDSELSFLMVDIDDFKRVNDLYGHQKGNEVLVGLARVLIDSIRGVDIAARYGGEEFAIILPQIDILSARVLAERLRIKVENTLFPGPDNNHISRYSQS